MQTAEEFLKDKFKQIYYNQPEGLTSKIPESRYLDLHVTGRIDGREQNYPEMMIEFAKLHVEAALKEASKAHLSIDMDEYAFDKMGEKILTEEAEEYNVNSILESYPLTNIK